MGRVATSAWAALAIAAPLGAQQDPAALVIHVRGDVTMSRVAGPTVSLSVGERAWVGDRIDPEPGGRAVLLTRTGAPLVVSESTTVDEPQGAGNPDLFARASATLARAASTDATATNRQGTIQPFPGYTTLLRPRNALTVSSSRPSFAWTRSPGQSYDLLVSRVGDGRPQIFEVGTDTMWTLPDSVPELEAEARYAWTVYVGGRRGGRPLPQQEFRVMSLLESVELQEHLHEIELLGLDPAGDGLFLAALAYRDMDLLYDAREALETVGADAPLSPDVERLLAEVLAELGDLSPPR